MQALSTSDNAQDVYYANPMLTAQPAPDRMRGPGMGVTSSASRKCRCSDFLQSTSLWAGYDGSVVTDRYETPAV